MLVSRLKTGQFLPRSCTAEHLFIYRVIGSRRRLLGDRSVHVLGAGAIVGLEFSYQVNKGCDHSLKNYLALFPSCQRGVSDDTTSC